MDTWLDQVGLRMRNVINKADDSGALELVDGQDVREHWDAFFRIRFRKLYFEDTQIIFYVKRCFGELFTFTGGFLSSYSFPRNISPFRG